MLITFDISIFFVADIISFLINESVEVKFGHLKIPVFQYSAAYEQFSVIVVKRSGRLFYN